MAFLKPELQYRQWSADNWTTILSKIQILDSKLYDPCVHHGLAAITHSEIETMTYYDMLENLNSTENMAHISVWSSLSELSALPLSGGQLKTCSAGTSRWIL